VRLRREDRRRGGITAGQNGLRHSACLLSWSSIRLTIAWRGLVLNCSCVRVRLESADDHAQCRRGRHCYVSPRYRTCTCRQFQCIYIVIRDSSDELWHQCLAGFGSWPVPHYWLRSAESMPLTSVHKVSHASAGVERPGAAAHESVRRHERSALSQLLDAFCSVTMTRMIDHQTTVSNGEINQGSPPNAHATSTDWHHQYADLRRRTCTAQRAQQAGCQP
jgi:hypothetical protein